MTQIEKLLEQIRNNPTNVRFEDLDKLLRLYGFECRPPRGGSHYVYKCKGCPQILTVPRHQPLKRVYVKRALKLIEEYGEPADE